MSGVAERTVPVGEKKKFQIIFPSTIASQSQSVAEDQTGQHTTQRRRKERGGGERDQTLLLAVVADSIYTYQVRTTHGLHGSID